MALKKIIEEIKKNKSFLITTHANVEGDALGSELALRDLLLYLGKDVTVVNADRIPQEYKFLPGLKYIKNISHLKEKFFDVFFVVDCSDLGRCDKVAGTVTPGITIINLDHHISNNKFGDINWVRPNASSASEMIYQLYKEMHIPLNKNRALWLYVGMLTDTGSFHYSNTSSGTLNIAADLLRYDLEVDKIYNSIYANIPFSDAQVLLKIINNINSDLDEKIIWFEIKNRFLRSENVTIDLAEHVLNFGRLIKEAEVIILFREYDQHGGRIRINLRSRKFNVNRIARIFGGGGHKNASGAIVKGSLNKVEQMVIEKTKQLLAHSRKFRSRL